MKLDISTATEKDRAYFRMLHHCAYRTVIESMFGWDRATQDAAADSEFDERNIHLIKADEKTVGAVGWQIKSDHIWFGPIYIHPDHQGSGIGTQVVQRLREEARTLKIPLRLRTLLANKRAKALYEKLGFEVTHQSEIHWHMQLR